VALGTTLGGEAELPPARPSSATLGMQRCPCPGSGEEEERDWGGRSPVHLVFSCGSLAEARSWLAAGLGSRLLQFPFSHSLNNTSN